MGTTRARPPVDRARAPGVIGTSSSCHPGRWRQVRLPFLRGALLALGTTLSSAAFPAAWVVNPGVTLDGTYTDNVNLQPADLARDDFVMQLTPSVTFRGLGAHAWITGSIAVPLLAYARSGVDDRSIYPQVSILGNAELVDNLFFVEGSIYVTQPNASPFGSQSISLISGDDNRYTAAAYRVSPYIKGELQGNVQYELRNNSIWTQAHDAPPGVSNAFVNQLVGRIATPAAPLGWFGDLDLDHVKFEDQGWQRVNLGRAGVRYAMSPQLRLQASAGYENDQFPLASYNAVLYGGAVEWRPSPRTTAYASVEHRFFGTAYLASLDYRTPMTVWAISASRSLTNFPQQLDDSSRAIGTGTLLDRLFKSRIPDPILRREAVDRYIEEQAIQPTSFNTINSYSQDILLTDSVTARAGITGTRNNLFFSAFYSRNRPIEGSGGSIADELSANSNYTEFGVNGAWTYRLTPVVNLNLSLALSRTDAIAPAVGRTNQGGASIELNRTLSQHTRVFVGTRYQRLTSDVTESYREAAVYAGIGYTYR